MRCRKPSSPARNELWSLLIYWDKRDIEHNGAPSTGDIGQHTEKEEIRNDFGITSRFIVLVIRVDSF